MAVRRFFAESIGAVGDTVTLAAAESRHLVVVNRCREGEHAELMDGCGTVAEVVLDVASPKQAQCRVLAVNHTPAPTPALTLFVAPPRAGGMSGIVRQATELGVRRIVPILTARTVSQPASKQVKRWQQDACEAIKQSGNPYLPIIEPPENLANALSRFPLPGYIGWVPRNQLETGEARAVPSTGDVAIWIGPEGGFSESELALLSDAGLVGLCVGAWTLRVETAVVACIGHVLAGC